MKLNVTLKIAEQLFDVDKRAADLESAREKTLKRGRELRARTRQLREVKLPAPAAAYD